MRFLHSDVFCMRLLMATQEKKESPTKKTRLPRDCKYQIKFKQILFAIYREDYKNIAFNIKKFKNQ